MNKFTKFIGTMLISLFLVCPTVFAGASHMSGPLYVNGQLIAGSQALMTQGNSYYVIPTSGDDNNNGESIEDAKETLQAGYDLLTANQNDVLYYFSGSSSATLDSTLTWAKNYTHFVGVTAPTNVAQRARIFQGASVVGASPLLNIMASGSSFRNFYIFQGVDDTTSIINVQVTGERNYFENVHFAGIGSDSTDVAGACSLKLNGGSENLFVNCSIGLDTIARGSYANSEILIDGSATRNTFINCLIYGWIESASNHPLVKLVDSSAIDRFLWFKDCIFLSESLNNGTDNDEVFSIPASMVTSYIMLQDSYYIGASDWDSNNRGKIYNNSVAAAGSAAGGAMTNQ